MPKFADAMIRALGGGGAAGAGGPMGYLDQIPGQARGILEPYMQAGPGADERARNDYRAIMQQYEGMPDVYGGIKNGPMDFLDKIMKGYNPSEGYKYKERKMIGAARNAANAGGYAGNEFDQEQQANMVKGLLGEDMQQYLSNIFGVLGGQERGQERGLLGRERGLTRKGGLEAGFGDRGFNAAQELVRALTQNLDQKANFEFQRAQQDLENKNMRRRERKEMFGQIPGLVGMLGGFFGVNMAYNPTNFASIGPIKMETRIPDILGGILRGYEAIHIPGKLKRQQEQEELANKIKSSEAEHAPTYYKNRAEETGYVNLLNALKANILGETGMAQANADVMNTLANARYKEEANNFRGISGKKYAPSNIAKLMQEKQEVEEGFLPGSNKMIQLDEGQKEEYLNKYNLQLQKVTTDLDARKRNLFASNLVQSIDSANVDDLVRYSGPKGRAELTAEKIRDLTGNPSEKYIKHKEAQKAVALEAQELRQFLGTSITPQMDKALRDMVDATNLTTSPETAKRMIEKSRGIIKKQLGTYRRALKTTAAYEGETTGSAHPEFLEQEKMRESFKANPFGRTAQDYTPEELMNIIRGGK